MGCCSLSALSCKLPLAAKRKHPIVIALTYSALNSAPGYIAACKAGASNTSRQLHSCRPQWTGAFLPGLLIALLWRQNRSCRL